MKHFILILICGLSLSAFSQALDSINFNQIYPFALRGEMDEVFNILSVAEDSFLTQKQLNTKQGYQERFLTNTEVFDFNTDDTIIIDLYKRFQHYWRSVTIEKVELKVADSLFFEEMTTFLKKNYKNEMNLHEIQENYYQIYQDFFESKGLHGLAMGKTGHLYDLYLWKEEKEMFYDIELPEEKVKVPVVFMKDFISNGWSHYTTFGRSYSGGWTTNEKLFCVKDAYDLNTENFKVSYVAHEGQHFVDKKSYPKLEQADLEYRAKLTELALAKESLFRVINTFIENSKNDKTQAHAFANYTVVKNLSDELFNKNYVDDIEDWKKLAPKKVSKSAIQLLKTHTKRLKSKGASIVETIIINDLE